MRLKSGASGAKWPTNSGLVAMFRAMSGMAHVHLFTPPPHSAGNGSPGAIALCAHSGRQHLAQRRIGNLALTAKRRRDVLAEVVVGLAVRGQIAPQIAAGRLVHVGDFLEQRITVGDDAFVVVRALFTA